MTKPVTYYELLESDVQEIKREALEEHEYSDKQLLDIAIRLTEERVLAKLEIESMNARLATASRNLKKLADGLQAIKDLKDTE